MANINVGFQKNLNLLEISDAAKAINNLAGAGVANDLRIIQNNLRNISTISYVSLFDGHFFFGSSSEFVFTNNDVVRVSTNVSVGSTTLSSNTDYYVCNSDASTKFKLSFTPSSVGFSTIGMTTVTPTNFYFIRKDPVSQENLINFDYPEIEDTSRFTYPTNIGLTFDETLNDNEFANFSIDRKYQKNKSINVSDAVRIEGVVKIEDPTSFNIDSANLSASNSPGLFIGTTRAFSDSTSFWTKVGTALSTSSSSVSVQEIYFDNEIKITGITTESAVSVATTSFTHKLEVIINNEPYYLLLRTT